MIATNGIKQANTFAVGSILLIIWSDDSLPDVGLLRARFKFLKSLTHLTFNGSDPGLGTVKLVEHQSVAWSFLNKMPEFNILINSAYGLFKWTGRIPLVLRISEWIDFIRTWSSGPIVSLTLLALAYFFPGCSGEGGVESNTPQKIICMAIF